MIPYDEARPGVQRYGSLGDGGLLDLLRNMSSREKLVQALRLSQLAIKLSEAGVRLAHPSADEREVFLRAASRRLSRDLMIRAYRWDPES
jgi:hypothetical protein